MQQQVASINLPTSHPVRALTGLARQIALPGEYAPERFPSFPALERTAVMGFSQPAGQSLPSGTDIKLMLSRQAAYPAWADVNLPAGAAWQATWQSGDPGAPGVIGAAPMIPRVSTWQSGPGGGAAAGMPLLGGAVKYFNHAIFAVDSGTGANPFMWLPAGISAVFTAAGGLGTTYQVAPTGGVSLVVNFDIWAGPGEVVGASANGVITAGQASCLLTFPGGSPTTGSWIRPSSVTFTAVSPNVADYTGVRVSISAAAGSMALTTGTGPGTITITGAATRCFVPVVFPTEFLTSKLPWSSTRTTAVAMLGTNVTQVLNKSGTIMAGRINPVVTDPFRASINSVATLHPAEKAWMPLELGLYTYCPPSTDMSEFWDYGLSQLILGADGITTPDAPVYRLDNLSMVNLLFCTAGGQDETLALTVSWHVEFRTSSALFPIALSGTLLESLHQAQLALSAAGFFFHNPDHKLVLNRVIQAVKKVLPASIMPPKKSGPTKIAVPQMRMAMPATSARGSGITRSPNQGRPNRKNKAKKPQVRRQRKK